MTNQLHLPARQATQIVCDLSTARDTPDQRLAEYDQLFRDALIRRERTADAIVFVFRARSGTREHVEDLARREAECCPFVDYRVETVEEEVIYTITNPIVGDDRASVELMFDAMYALPEHAGAGMSGLLERFAEQGVRVIQPSPDAERFELRD
jgi:hypothetical protein